MLWYICPHWFIEILCFSMKENVLICCSSQFYVQFWAVHWIQVREENPILYSHKTQLNIKLSLLQHYNNTLRFCTLEFTHSTKHSVPRVMKCSPGEGNCNSLSKNFPDFCGTQRIITVFARVCYLSLSWARYIWSTAFHHFSWILFFTLFSRLYLGLESRVFPSGFPTKTLYVFLFSFIPPTCSAHLIFHHLYKSCHSSLPTLLQLHLTSSHLTANVW